MASIPSSSTQTPPWRWVLALDLLGTEGFGA
jgi:hypothetical protein